MGLYQCACIPQVWRYCCIEVSKCVASRLRRYVRLLSFGNRVSLRSLQATLPWYMRRVDFPTIVSQDTGPRKRVCCNQAKKSVWTKCVCEIVFVEAKCKTGLFSCYASGCKRDNRSAKHVHRGAKHAIIVQCIALEFIARAKHICRSAKQKSL